MTAYAAPMDQWQLEYHELMVTVLRARATIRREAGIIGIAAGLWSVARDLKHILPLQARVYKSMLDLPEGAFDDEIVASSVKSTSELLTSIDDLLETARRKGLTNRTLTAGSLAAIRRHGEEIAEHLDVLRTSLDPEVQELILHGRDDFAASRGIPLDSLLRG